MDSVKHEKFRGLAESRTNKALEAIGRLGNLSNKSLYDWEQSEVQKILRALRSAVSDVEKKFDAPGSKSNPKFKL